MRYDPHREPGSEPEAAHWFGLKGQEAIDVEATKALLELGSLYPKLGNAIGFPYERMKVVVARRTGYNRKNTVIPKLEEATCEDDSALFMLQDDPDTGTTLFMFKPEHPHYWPDGKPRTPSSTAHNGDGRGGGDA